MSKKEEWSTRFIKSPLVPLILWIVFIAIFYGIYFSQSISVEINDKITIYKLKEYFDAMQQQWLLSFKVADFGKKYWVFIPVIYWLLSIIIHYLFCFIRWVIRLKCFVSSLILVFIVYWFNLFMWIQLMFYEPRYTAVAIYIIDIFSKPILWASALTFLLSFVFIFIKTKKS